MMPRNRIILIIGLAASVYLPFCVKAQKVMPLYRDSIPNSIPSANMESSRWTDDSILIISQVSRPELSIYLPPRKKANGTAVLICPGGGYWILAASHEGSDVARRLNQDGIAAFVLKYRIPDDKTMRNRSAGPLQDAQEALLWIRQHARQYHIKKNRIGIMGFSAGGHLASSAGVHFDSSFIANPGSISLRPDFMVLVYPVISFSDSIGHIGSRNQLLGQPAPARQVDYFSNERQVTAQTPPAFLVHARDDNVVNVRNSLDFAAELDRYHIPEELFLYEKGGHGFGMHNKTSDRKWIDAAISWILTDKWKK